jgi:hypothetical protein
MVGRLVSSVPIFSIFQGGELVYISFLVLVSSVPNPRKHTVTYTRALALGLVFGRTLRMFYSWNRHVDIIIKKVEMSAEYKVGDRGPPTPNVSN